MNFTLSTDPRDVAARLAPMAGQFIMISGHGGDRLEYVVSTDTTDGTVTRVTDCHAPETLIGDALAWQYAGFPITAVEVDCAVYALCDRAAVTVYDFGILGHIPACQRCADRTDHLSHA